MSIAHIIRYQAKAATLQITMYMANIKTTITPTGEASTTELLKAWTDNWNLEKERYFNEVNLLIHNVIEVTCPDITNLNKIYK